jgi:Kae1-associated kinase Bud32|tara:strand:- start:2240 stop:2875 length:636 start_codon:yes stop_codon:yes gene_type:complete
MTQKIIAQGAEAKIILSDNFIIKDRIKKSYRIPELDEKIRKRRTKSEAKLLKKASEIINSPKPFFEPQVSFKIKMPFIKGKKLSKHLDDFPEKQQLKIFKQVGENIAKLHDSDIIHGDLTTSNMIHTPTKKNRGDVRTNDISFIDFGLGFISYKIEDKAVDLHLLKQALEARHFKNWEKLFNEVLKNYKKSEKSDLVLKQLEKVEKRGRYK